jgi:glycosyltransferase involved in cell wall biosynthesis
MLLAYSNYLDINLWFTPTDDNPSIERVKKIGALCKSITVFKPTMLVDNSELRAKFHSTIESSDCIHIFRQIWLMDIRHKCIFWDIDELPVELRDSSKNFQSKPIAPKLINSDISRHSQAWKNSRRVFSSSRLEVNPAIGDTFCMPNVYSTDKINRTKKSLSSVIFVGNMNFFPNVNAIFYFSYNILPLLSESTNFILVGRSPVDRKLKGKFDKLMKKNNRIKQFFNVESCTPFYQESAVAVAPINFGGGTKLKILEAFNHYCPVVSTSKGCEGLEVTDGKEVLLRDTPEEFAKACQRIIQNPEIGNSLAKNAHTLLTLKYSQNNLNNLLHSCLSEEGVI